MSVFSSFAMSFHLYSLFMIFFVCIGGDVLIGLRALILYQIKHNKKERNTTEYNLFSID